MANTVVTSVVVAPKRNELGAFQVKITGGGFAKSPYKWFYGRKIFPASNKFFGRKLYGRICGLIEESARSGEKASWQRAANKGAWANQKISEAIGACD